MQRLPTQFHSFHFSSLPNGKKSWEWIEIEGLGRKEWNELICLSFLFLIFCGLGAVEPPHCSAKKREQKEKTNESMNGALHSLSSTAKPIHSLRLVLWGQQWIGMVLLVWLRVGWAGLLFVWGVMGGGTRQCSANRRRQAKPSSTPLHQLNSQSIPSIAESKRAIDWRLSEWESWIDLLFSFSSISLAWRAKGTAAAANERRRKKKRPRYRGTQLTNNTNQNKLSFFSFHSRKQKLILICFCWIGWN